MLVQLRNLLTFSDSSQRLKLIYYYSPALAEAAVSRDTCMITAICMSFVIASRRSRQDLRVMIQASGVPTSPMEAQAVTCRPFPLSPPQLSSNGHPSCYLVWTFAPSPARNMLDLVGLGYTSLGSVFGDGPAYDRGLVEDAVGLTEAAGRPAFDTVAIDLLD